MSIEDMQKISNMHGIIHKYACKNFMWKNASNLYKVLLEDMQKISNMPDIFNQYACKFSDQKCIKSLQSSTSLEDIKKNLKSD